MKHEETYRAFGFELEHFDEMDDGQISFVMPSGNGRAGVAIY